MKFITSLLILSQLSIFSIADELKLSYLEIKESTLHSYSLLLKIDSRDKKSVPISMLIPKTCKVSIPKTTHLINNTYVHNWKMICTEGLENNRLHISGLKDSKSELLLRLDLFSGVSHSALLTPTNTSYLIPRDASSLQIAKTYSWLGITHILLGFDHLLFVFALLMLVKNIRRLLLTITAFTLAHSLTMAVSTLNIIHLPQAPIEAIIALSILFLAMEIMHETQGKVGLTSKYPWLIAFLFGLLHGFGFAGALEQIGLPQHAVTLALVFFNLGVELGQLMFVISVIVIVIILRRLSDFRLLKNLQTIIVYSMGGISSYWLIERILSF